MSPPPPPPPHGEVPKSSGLPPGKYDIFVIPEHSAGSGFLYLPSLQPNVNSFAAGFASALILVALCQSMAPAFRAWWDSFQGMGTMSIAMLILGVGFGAWALGRTQTDGTGSDQGTSGSSSHGGSGGFGGTNARAAPNTGAPPPQPPPHSPGSGQEAPKSSWQQRPSPQPGTKKPEAPKGSWEKAREETRKKEEERKGKEAEQKRRDEIAKRLAELRAKEARERLEREKEKERQDKEAQQRAKELAAKLEKEARERETARKGSSYAYSGAGAGEKTSMWPNGRPPVPSHAAGPSSAPSSPNKKPPAPTAKTFLGTDDDAYSYRPYDQPRRPKHKKSASSLTGSEASWAPSHTTAHTTPPQSSRGRYSTKDPDKIVIKAVYSFTNQFAKTPASQLISGYGSVTDGLILRITTEGLFIDDDVRGVPQREWDVKAWTLKVVEVWCPPHCLNPASAASAGSGEKNSPSLLHKFAGRHADRGVVKPLTGDEADAYLTAMLLACKDGCRFGLSRSLGAQNANVPQTGDWKTKGLHIVRATIRDQEGKRFFFVVDEHESWKVAVGLQRLRRGTMARQLGVSGMSASDARGTLEMLGW